MNHVIGPLFVLLVVTVVFGIMLLQWWNSPAQKARRRLRALQAQPIRGIAEGSLAKITGRLRYVGEPLRAPLSGRRCAYYEVWVKEKRGKNGWKTVVHESHGVPFLLEDGTGRAYVDLTDAQASVIEDRNLRSGFLQDAPQEAEALLAAHGQASTGALGFNRTLRYHEGVLEEDESVTVLGHARWEVDPDAREGGEGYRDRAMRLRVSAPQGEPLCMSDDPDVL